MKENLYFTKINTSLLLFLEKKLPNRISRFEAFLDLLKHQINHCDGHPNGINIPFGITYESLAKEWNWDRKTVMSFLKSLQEMGVLECKRDGYNMVVRILNLAYLPTQKG